MMCRVKQTTPRKFIGLDSFSELSGTKDKLIKSIDMNYHNGEHTSFD